MIDTNTSENDLITVIVPVYNVGKYLTDCLTSIINQTYCNIEILLIVSPSDDDSERIAEDFSKSDIRIQIIRRDKLGLSDARNVGIERSAGKYICFIDSDDYISCVYIETLYYIIQLYGCDIAQCGFASVDENNHPIDNDVFDPNSMDIVEYTGVDMCYRIHNPTGVTNVVAWNKLYRKSLFNEIRYPFGKFHEDEGTTYKLFYDSNSIGVIEKKLYYYRQSASSITRDRYSLKRADILELLEERAAFFMERGEEVLSKLAKLQYIRLIGWNIWQANKLEGNEVFINTLSKNRKRMMYEILSSSLFTFSEKIKAIFVGYFPRMTCYLQKKIGQW